MTSSTNFYCKHVCSPAVEFDAGCQMLVVLRELLLVPHGDILLNRRCVLNGDDLFSLQRIKNTIRTLSGDSNERRKNQLCAKVAQQYPILSGIKDAVIVPFGPTGFWTTSFLHKIDGWAWLSVTLGLDLHADDFDQGLQNRVMPKGKPAIDTRE